MMTSDLSLGIGSRIWALYCAFDLRIEQLFWLRHCALCFFFFLSITRSQKLHNQEKDNYFYLGAHSTVVASNKVIAQMWLGGFSRRNPSSLFSAA